MGDSASGWSLRTVRFRFQIGELAPLSAPFPVAVLDRHFMDLTGDPDALQLPLAEFGSRVAGFIVYGHPTTRELPMVTMCGPVVRFVNLQYERCFVTLDGSYEDYLRKFPSKRRSALRAKIKKLFALPGEKVEMREYREEGEMDEFHRLACELSARTYQERLFGKGLPATPEFGARLRELARLGQGRGYVLVQGAKAIAFLYAKIDAAGRIAYDYVGYDPDYRDYSPGTVLHLLILERLFAAKDSRVFDFGEGDAEHKRFLANGTARCADLYYFPPNPRALALGGSQIALHLLSRGITRTVEALGVKDKIRRFVRRRVSVRGAQSS